MAVLRNMQTFYKVARSIAIPIRAYPSQFMFQFCVIFLLNSVMHLRTIAALLASVTATLAGGKIAVVGKDSVDFGKYAAREKKVATYTIRNVGKDTLKILKVRKTCGCASATASRTELKPNETAEIEVVILPNTIFGLYSKNTFIESTDAANRFLKVNTAGNAIPLVEVKPSMSFNAGRIKKNTEWKKDLSLTATELGVRLGQPVMTNSHPIEVALTQTGTNDLPAYSLALHLKATDQSGDLRCKIAVPVISPTNHPPISISVNGRIGSELSVIPGMAYLTLTDQPQTRKFTLRILSQRSRVLTPKELLLPDHEEISTEVVHDPKHNTLEVTMTFSPEFAKELYAEEKVPLTFSIPGAASARMLCRIRK
jgi:hypothetical protein